MQEVASVAIGKIVLQFAGWICISRRNVSNGFGEILVNALVKNDVEILDDGVVVIDISQFDND